MEELIQFDKQLLLWFNGSDSLFLDSLITTLTNAKTWIPLYLALFYIVIKSSQTARDVLLILAAAGLCVLLAGTIDDTIVKPMVARWRPGRDPEIGLLVDTVDGYRGGRYGFFSAHASNTFSIALFFSLLMRQRLFTVFMVAWSLTNCYTRLYLGVHYPGDVLVGLCWGAIVGTGVYFLYRFILRYLYRRSMASAPAVTPAPTTTPTSAATLPSATPDPPTFSQQLCDIPMAVIALTLVYALTRALLA